MEVDKLSCYRKMYCICRRLEERGKELVVVVVVVVVAALKLGRGIIIRSTYLYEGRAGSSVW
jgi:hypothetical protein